VKTDWRSLLEPVSSLFFPPNCYVCGAERKRSSLLHNVCEECWSSVQEVGDAFCFRCGAPLSAAQEDLPTTFLCGNCRGARVPYKTMRSLYLYRTPLREMIHLFKFNGMLDLGRELGRRLAAFAADLLELRGVDLVLPVPLHPLRRVERGFNQSRILAGIVAGRLGKPAPGRALRRIRNTHPQSTLEPEQRRGNVKDAFTVTPAQALKKAKVLLVDDVTTTETTVRECARTLKRAGAAEVAVLTLARAE